MDKLTDAQKDAIKEAILSRAFQLLIGAEEWGLTEDEEMELWGAIRTLEGR